MLQLITDNTAKKTKPVWRIKPLGKNEGSNINADVDEA